MSQPIKTRHLDGAILFKFTRTVLGECALTRSNKAALAETHSRFITGGDEIFA